MMTHRSSRSVVSLALLLSGFLARPAWAADDPLAAARSEFMGAYAAAEAGSIDAADSDRLRAYPLYAYLGAARLKAQLARTRPDDDGGIDDAVAAFITAQGGTLVANDLRRAWLGSLATRKRWDRYLASLPATLAANDSVLRCQQFAARIALNQTAGLGPAVVQQWQVTDKSLPACDAAFTWAREQKLLTPTLIEARARLVVRNGYAALAKVIAAPLPSELGAPINQWAALIEQPQRAIDALIADPSRTVETEALQDGWLRLARADPDAAAARYAGLRQSRVLDDAAASPFARSLALGMAWSRKPDTLSYFAQVLPADLDSLSTEWWARSALWAGDWPQAAKAIAAMSDTQRSEQRWRYWAARAAAAGGDPAAGDLLTTLALEDGWYPALAAAQTGSSYVPHPQTLTRDAAVIGKIESQAGFIRARELFRVALRNQATAEFWAAFEPLDEAARFQAVHMTMGWGWYEQGVATATRMKLFTEYALLYPRPYDAPVKAGVALSGLTDNLIYGVLRQESLYRADAVSSANAYGLLQMLPETATRTARKWQRPLPSRAMLFDPEVNVPLGAAHLRDLVDRFNGQLPVAIAGYNAGPNAAARWLPAVQMPADVWIENIPYNETRTYVQRVLWHSMVFGWRQQGKPQPLAAWLKPVSLTPVPPGLEDIP